MDTRILIRRCTSWLRVDGLLRQLPNGHSTRFEDRSCLGADRIAYVAFRESLLIKTTIVVFFLFLSYYHGKTLLLFLSILAKLMRRNLTISSSQEGVVDLAREKRRKRPLFINFAKYDVLHPSFPLLP